jgi:DNA helicase-4
MALIHCPECNKQISDKAEHCPHCGLPGKYFAPQQAQEALVVKETEEKPDTNYKVIRNMLIAFDHDYLGLFNTYSYISASSAKTFYQRYYSYVEILKSPLARQYIKNNSYRIGFGVEQCDRFTLALDDFYEKVDRFNEAFVTDKLIEYRDYFDTILQSVDPGVKLDEEQRRAVITDDDYCC